MLSTAGDDDKGGGDAACALDPPRKLSRGSSGALALSRRVSSPSQHARPPAGVSSPRAGDDAARRASASVFGRANPFDTDFSVKELVAQGGFGKVFKCRSAIDGQWYAVKLEQFWLKPRAYFNPSEVRDVLLNEALALARLDHENVCRYFATWVQGSLVSADGSAQAAAVRPLATGASRLSLDERWSALPAVDDASSERSSELLGLDALGFDVDAAETSDLSAGESEAEHRRPRGACAGGDAAAPPGALCTRMDVYIQMALYEGKTLRHWLEQRERVRAADSLGVFRQILAGLAYIHRQGIVHRDIKPANVFLTRDACVKIGDFGLAKRSLPTRLQLRAGGSPGVGTALYCSPEQARGSSAATAAADVFSLGVVLCELFCAFSTQMERHVVLAKAREGELPAALEAEHPEVAALIRAMLRADPAQRPTCADMEQLDLVRGRGPAHCVSASASASSALGAVGAVGAELAPEETSARTHEVLEAVRCLEDLEQQQAQLLGHIADAVDRLSQPVQVARRPAAAAAAPALGQALDLTRVQEWVRAARELGAKRREELARVRVRGGEAPA